MKDNVIWASSMRGEMCIYYIHTYTH